MKIIQKFRFYPIYAILALFIFNFSFIGCKSDEGTTEPTTLGPRIVVAPQPELYFGQIPSGQGAYREFKISNSGDQTLVIPELVVEGTDAELFTLTDSGQIELGEIESTIIGLKFNPQSSGMFSARVKIESNAKTSPDYYDLTAGGTEASGASLTFERIIGTQESDGASSVRITHNGGFIIAGSTFDPSLGWNVATLTLLDRYGNVQWTEKYPGAGTSGFSSVVIADDGGFVAAGGSATSDFTSNKVYVVKTDANGLIENWWTYGGTLVDYAYAIEKTNDGGYILAGKTNNTGTEGDLLDALLLKLDGSFKQEWLKSYGSKNPVQYEGENAHGVKQTADGGYVFAGSQSTSGATPAFDFYLVKTDADGVPEWSGTYGGTDWDEANDIIIAADGGYVITGYSVGNAQDVYVVKTNSEGLEEWAKSYGGNRNDVGSSIISTSDAGYLIVGTSKSFSVKDDPDDNVYMIKTDNSGTKLWEENYGGNSGDGASCVREDTPGGFIISGSTRSYSRSAEMYILKVDADGQIQ